MKRILDAVKGEVVVEETIPHFMDAFEVLVKSNLSQEVMRSLSLFITWAFHTPPASNSRTPKSLATATSRSGTPVPFRRPVPDQPSANGTPTGVKYLPKKKLGIKILVMYSEILCEKGNLNHVKKFARTVTNKWLLYLLAEEDVEIVAHGCKILARLLVAHGSAYTTKFASKSGGFTIMANRLRRFWDVQTIWPICLSILFGYDVADIDFGRDFELASLVDLFGKRKVMYPESLQIITSMLQHGFKEVMRHQEDPASPAKHLAPIDKTSASNGRPRAKSMELAEAIETRCKKPSPPPACNLLQT